MFRFLIYLLSFTTLLASCNSDNDATKSEQAYQDYKNFVAQVEKDTVVNERDLQQDWERRTDTLKLTFDRHKSGITSYVDDYEPERREEVSAFNERLEVAFEERQKNYDEVSHRYKLRKEILGIDVSEDDMSAITAANIAATYNHFVTTLQSNLKGYTTNDWQLIEGWWNALQNRRQDLSNQLQSSDQEKIIKFQETYQKLRTEALTENA